MNTKAAFALGAALWVFSLPAEAQQANRVYRLGYLSSGAGIELREKTFRQALAELGYVEGKNLVIEWRFAKGGMTRRPDLAVDLAHLNVDCIVVTGSGETAMAKKATSTIPIVMMSSTDPVGTGFVRSLARPGGNVTGLTSISADLGGKALELLKEIKPTLARVVAPYPAGGVSQNLFFKLTEISAQALKIKLVPVPVRGSHELAEMFRIAIQERSDGVLSRLPPTTPPFQRKEMVELAAKNRLPAIYFEEFWVNDGGLMSYGPNRVAMDRRAATYVDKILKGVKPADLPVEQPTKFEFVINLKTAKQIDLTIPPNVLARADRVIR